MEENVNIWLGSRFLLKSSITVNTFNISEKRFWATTAH